MKWFIYLGLCFFAGFALSVILSSMGVGFWWRMAACIVLGWNWNTLWRAAGLPDPYER